MLRPEPIFLETYLRDAESLSEDEFLAQFDHPFLLIPGIERNSLSQLYGAVSRESTTEQKPSGASGDDQDNTVILCLGMRPKYGLSFDRMTVGRASEADIVILDDTVSKFHAEFSWDATRERCVITDLNSRNGTRIAGEKLKAGANGKLSTGMVLSLGNIQARFFTPRAFLSWLRTRLGAGLDTSWLLGMGSEDSTYNSVRKT